MKQKLLLLLVTLAFLLPARLSAFYYTHEGTTLSYKVIDKDSKTCQVVDLLSLSSEKKVVIPEVANDGTTDYTVTSIANACFWSSRCEDMNSVLIPNSVTTIGNSAFRSRSSLTSVVIPNSVTSIGESAFRGCSGLTSVVIPNSVTTISKETFLGCSNLTSVVIPNSVTTIGEWAFYDCSGLTSVVIGNSVSNILYHAFSDCSSLNSLVIPNSVTFIGPDAFDGCSGLASLEFNAENCYASWETYKVFPSNIETLVIGENVTKIPLYAFHNCSKLTSVVIPNSVTEIGSNAFESCSGLTSLYIGNSVETIGSDAFKSCSGLTSVVIPNSVTHIVDGAFANCRLDTIVMGNGIKRINKNAFKDCRASNVYITAQTPPKIESATFYNYNGILYLQGEAAANAYNEDWYWREFNKEIMTEPTALEIEGMTSISGKVGDTFQLKAKMTPEEVTLPYVLWRSTNPKIATVDNNGVVTLHEYSAEDLTRADGDEDNDGTCRIIAESLYFDGPIAEIVVNNTGVNGIESVIDRNVGSIDYSQPYEVYNMNGLKVSDSTEGLVKGIYIIRQAKSAVKTVVR